MDYALQVHGAKYVFPVPDGLKELSSDIIREVLRHQPEHINGFVADYLETMLLVRESTRDSAIVICDVFQQGFFFDNLYRSRGIHRDQAHNYAIIIQSNWRGYYVRKKIKEWLQKKQKFQEERERRKTIRIDELLQELGITYAEATRAAEIIQDAYKESKKGKWISNDFGEIWVGETIPFGQRIYEGDRALGRFGKWEKADFGDFFEMDDIGNIKYVWPRVGQLRKMHRDEVPEDAQIVDFFAMRDLQGREQYSYMIKPKTDSEIRGIPIGFLIPLPKALLMDSTPEVEFVDPKNASKMGPYTYVFKDDITREELQKFDELLKAEAKTSFAVEIPGEFDYNPHWVLPRALVRIKQRLLLPTDDEVKFTSLPPGVVCENDNFTFRAETLEFTSKIIRYILRDECLTPEQGISESVNFIPYKTIEIGRIFPVEMFSQPDYIQKLVIIPESDTGANETEDMFFYEYVFYPLNATANKLTEKESLIQIHMMRFQGHRSAFRGSAAFENKVFIMGPKLMAPNGKNFTYESLFWEEFGEEAWYKLLYDSAGVEEPLQETEISPDAEEEIVAEESYINEFDETVVLDEEKSEKEELMKESSEAEFSIQTAKKVPPYSVEIPEEKKDTEKEEEEKEEVEEKGKEEEAEDKGKEEVEEKVKEEEMEEEEEEIQNYNDEFTADQKISEIDEDEKFAKSKLKPTKSVTKPFKKTVRTPSKSTTHIKSSSKSALELKKSSKSTTEVPKFNKSTKSPMEIKKSSLILNKSSKSAMEVKKPTKDISSHQATPEKSKKDLHEKTSEKGQSETMDLNADDEIEVDEK